LLAISMLVGSGWRAKGVGSARVAGAIGWARNHRLHRLSLRVFPHKAAAIALYRKYGFDHEGLRRKQVRWLNGGYRVGRPWPGFERARRRG
jgi:RimJ/RimL family protein N-acetyltransferase